MIRLLLLAFYTSFASFIALAQRPQSKASITSNKSLVNTSKSPYAQLEALSFEEVTLTDGFWADRVKTAMETMIPEMWAIYSNAEVSHALRNFEIAAGIHEGQHEGAPFHDGDFYKLIEAASMAYAISGDERYDQMIDDVIPLIEASQRADGYIHTPVMIETKNNPESAVEFRDRMDFESYNMGHLMTAAAIHYRATGKTSLLNIAQKAVDYLYTYTERFPEKMAQNAICPSHYMGTVEMYRTTGDTKYLELAKKFIDIRSLMTNGTDHNQDRIPFRDQRKAVGHAVRANYLYAGVADVYAETGDITLKKALDSIWQDLVSTKLYITGGCGALYDGVSPNGTSYQPSEIQQVHQAYGREYQLPNAGAHNETCANIGSVLWNWRMFQTSKESRYTDLVETTLFNSVLSGVNLNGKGYFYTNPLSHQMDLPFQMRWPNVRDEYISYSNCCPPNTIRTITEVINYLYSKDENGIWFNLYAGSAVTTAIADQQLRFSQKTAYPWDGEVVIDIKEAPKRDITFNLRLPDWCQEAELSLNGKKMSLKVDKGYIQLEKNFVKGDQIVFNMKMPAMLIASNPLVEETRNQVAIQRGPVIYCIEGNDLPDNINLSDVIIPSDIDLSTEFIEIDGVQLTALRGNARYIQGQTWEGKLYQPVTSKTGKTSILLIPHFAWANRDEADMAVWLPLHR